MNKVEIFPWNDRFFTGIAEIDEQHQQLVNLLNAMVSQMAFGGSGCEIDGILNELMYYAELHFRSEESIWNDIFSGDEWENQHEASHQQFISEISDLEAQKLSCSSDEMMKTIIRFLTHWLALHIIEQDIRMANVTRAVRSGISLDEAKHNASEEMAGSTRGMIDTVMFMYDCLADRTLQLSTEINRRSIAEQSLIKINSELHEKACVIEDRNRQLNAIFRLSPDGFIAFSQDGNIQFVNPAFQMLTGISHEEILGRGETTLNLLLNKLSDSSKPYTEIKDIITEYNKELPSTMFFLNNLHRTVLKMISLPGDSANISKILYFRDVTRETLIDQKKSEFLTIAAHELRNPMASIYGFSEVLMSQDLEPTIRNEIAEIIHGQSEIMVAILNELLDLARIESGRGKEFCFKKLSIQELLDSVLNSFVPPIGRNSPTLTYPDEPAYILVDSVKITQVLLNVLSNAYKYSPGGGVVEISADFQKTFSCVGNSSNQMVSINISDQGIGMTSKEMERIGERFYRANRTGTIPGTGLGMTIVKEILELHGGQIQLHSVLNVGTTVTLQIPRRA